MSIAHPQTYDMHPVKGTVYWLTCTLALVCGIATILLSARAPDVRWIRMSLGLLFLLGGLAMFIRPETVVESDTRIVRRQLRLLGRFLLWSRAYPFSDFAAVVVQRVQRSNAADDPDRFFVWLRRHSGRQILVRYFEADSTRQCRTAHELAHTLSSDLNVEIDENNT